MHAPATLAVLFAVLSVQPAPAQQHREAPYRLVTEDRFGVGVSGGAAFARHDLGPATLGTGAGLEATVAYRLLPPLWAYGGWEWYRFSAEGFLAGTDGEAVETGYVLGLRFEHPLGPGALGYFVEAGGVYGHLEVEVSGSDEVLDTGHGLGWQLGAGLIVPLGPGWRLAPGIRYRSLTRDVEIDGDRADADLEYLAVELGIGWTF